MARKRYTLETIIRKLREAEVLQGQQSEFTEKFFQQEHLKHPESNFR